ncbi:hypothetical protein ACX3P5_13785 [Pantoea sp. S-LA4]
MITLNFGTKGFPLTREEAAFVAESLTAALSCRPATAPAFTSGMHGHISVMSKKRSLPGSGRKKRTGNSDQIRRNPITS